MWELSLGHWRDFGRPRTLSRVEMSMGFLSREGIGNMGTARAKEQLAEKNPELSELSVKCSL